MTRPGIEPRSPWPLTITLPTRPSLLMDKIPCASQNTEAKILPADVCVFDPSGRISPATVHSAYSRFDSGVKWWIHVSSIVTYLCKNSFLMSWKSCKQRAESSTLGCFWSTVIKRSTHFEHSFLIDKCSCHMVNTLHFDLFNSSVISHNFNLRSAKTSLWSFWGLPGQLPNLRSTSLVSILPRLKSAYHLLTVVTDGAESE